MELKEGICLICFQILLLGSFCWIFSYFQSYEIECSSVLQTVFYYSKEVKNGLTKKTCLVTVML